MVHHIVSCPHQKTQCHRCEADIEMDGMLRHLAHTCPERQIPCVFHEFGCKAKMKASQHITHLREYELKHIGLKVNNFERLVERLEEKVQECSEEIRALTRN